MPHLYDHGVMARTLPLSDRMLEHVAARFRVLGEPARLRIVQLLEGGELSVGEIVEALSAQQSNVSRHLQTLHDSGIVGRRKEGGRVLYSIADPTIFRLCDLVCRSAQKEAERTLREMGG